MNDSPRRDDKPRDAEPQGDTWWSLLWLLVVFILAWSAACYLVFKGPYDV